jgi:BMFP domain-containing protein YqiC
MRVLTVRILGLTIILVLVLNLQNGLLAQDPSLNTRISSLEAQSTQLRSLVSRLESQVNQLESTRFQGPSKAPPLSPKASPSLPSPGKPVSPADPKFERLATLVIEQRERINDLETRLARLEANVLPAKP